MYYHILLQFVITIELRRCILKIDGVHYHKRDRKWNANLRMNSMTEYLGSFRNKFMALHAVYQKKNQLDIKIDETTKLHERYLEWLKNKPNEVKIAEKKIENLKRFQESKKK